jgi:ACS family glucarate transporter-like MFS transporter
MILINFVDRMNLSVAARPIASEFGLSPVQMGYLFSCFQWGYVICVLPIGVLADRIGTKRLAGWGLALWSAATMVTGASVGFGSMLTARVVMGAGEATSYPALGRITRDWFPQRERGVVTMLCSGGGSFLGPAVGALATGVLVTLFGWRVGFVLLGAAGFVWFAAWMLWFDQPERARWLSAAERDRILAERNGTELASPEESTARPSSFRYMLTQRTVWGLLITQCCIGYTLFLFLTWMPSFLQSTQQISIMTTGIFTAIPYVCALGLSVLVARGSDWVLARKPGAVRAGGRRNFVVAMMMVALVVVSAPFISTTWQLLVVLTLVVTGATGAASLNLTLNTDLMHNPRDVGMTWSIAVFGGNGFGILSPIITGYIVAATGGFTGAFIVAACLLVFGATVSLVMTRHPVEGEHAVAGLAAQSA